MKVSLSSLKVLFILIERVIEGEETESDLPSTGLLPKRPQKPEPGWANARNQQFLSALSSWCWGTRPWVILHCFPRLPAGRWIRSGAARSGNGPHMWCWYCRHRINLKCHCAGLKNFSCEVSGIAQNINFELLINRLHFCLA